jgi:hypothetical protein
MKNLAGDKDCDRQIRQELERCRINVVEADLRDHEVPASIMGKLEGFTFIRGWCYWIVDGKVPSKVADYLFVDPVGKTDIRVDGSAGCPDPKGRDVYKYHIDSEIGLRVFVDVLQHFFVI